jgi:serine/threonine protein kinase
MLQQDLGNFDVFETPIKTRLVFLHGGKNGSHFYRADLDNLQEPTKTNLTAVIYDIDRFSAMLPADWNDEEKDTIKEVIRMEWSKIRSAIRANLENHGVKVIELKQGEFDQYPDPYSGIRTAWTQVKDDPDIVCKISGERNNFSIPGFKKFTGLNHPNLSPETIYIIRDGYTVSVAPDLGDHDNLINTFFNLDLKTRLRYLLDGIRATAYLHGKSIIHCDIKLENLLIKYNQAILIDLEGSVQIDRDMPTKFTESYHEYCYYPESGKNKYDEKTDVFSWGICLLKALGQPTDLQNIFTPTIQKRSSRSEKEHLFYQYIDLQKIPLELAALIKSMIQSNREERPSIEKVENLLEKIIENLNV